MSSLRFLDLEQAVLPVGQVCSVLTQFLFPLFQVHEYLRSKLCSLYENDCIFDKFECCWNGSDRQVQFFFPVHFRLFQMILKMDPQIPDFG